jgi:tellurite resistance protein TerB
MFGFGLKAKAKEAVNQFSGNRDFLEGMCSICALTAASEGGIDDAEFDKTIAVIKSNSAISAGFNVTEIETTFGRLAPKTATRSGRSELKAEIQQCLDRDKTGKMGQALIIAALDVADEGGISEKETATLRDLAALCGQNLDKLMQG